MPNVGRPKISRNLSLEAVESILIRKALQRFQGNVSLAAEALGLSRGALYRPDGKVWALAQRSTTLRQEKRESGSERPLSAG